MADPKSRLVLSDQSGGRNRNDPPWAIKPTECVEAFNVNYFQSPFGRKRGGCIQVSTAFSAGGPFTGVISTLLRHVPGTDEGLAELWAVDQALVVGRMAAAATFAAPTLKDALTGNGWDVHGASINGKFAIAAKTAVNRLHYWDGTTVRRAGLAASAAPTVADSAVGGAYPAVLRYYRERSIRVVAGVTMGRSEPSASVAFTPNGGFTAAIVTQAAVINEGETHWEVEASIDNVTFYRIATVLIATSTYSDSAVTTTYNSNPLSALTGVYTLQKSYKFVAADQNRLLGLGSYTATDKQDRLEISAVIGSLDVGDEERVDTTLNYYMDFDEGSSGPSTGLHGPVFGNYFVFKYRQCYILTPTGDLAQPFKSERLSNKIGAICQKSISIGEDGDGNPALYWMSHRGPYRWSLRGLEYLGRNIEDVPIYLSTNANRTKTAHTIFCLDKRQVWFWFAINGNDECTCLCVYDIITGGWSRYAGTSGSNTAADNKIARARCSVIFSETLGAAMSLNLEPYLSRADDVNTLWRADTSDHDDAGTAFQAFTLTRAIEPGAAGFYGEVGNSELLAAAANGVTITDLVTADFGLQTRTGTVSLTPDLAETYIVRPVLDTAVSGDVRFIQHQIGDAVASTAAWNLGRIVVPITKRGAVSA